MKPDKSGEIPRPMATDVEGGGKFINKSDDVWVIHRNLYHMDAEQRYESKLFIDKVRNTEGGGFTTPYNEPMYFTFKKDWTGFTTVGEPVNYFQEKETPEIPF